MFSFFRRSKKDKERATSEMCKNTGDGVAAPPDRGREVAPNAVPSEVTADEKNEPTDAMGERACPSAPMGTISYAAALRQPEGRGASVKPCGHGTTGVAPRPPVSYTRRNTGTPPASPKLDLKKAGRNVERQISSEPPSPKGEKRAGLTVGQIFGQRTKGSDENPSPKTSEGPEGEQTARGSLQESPNKPPSPAGTKKLDRQSSNELASGRGDHVVKGLDGQKGKTSGKTSRQNSNEHPCGPRLTATDTLVESISSIAPLVNGIDDEKKNLINQEAKFQSQLNDLSKQLSIRDAEATKLRFQMEELQRDVFAKSAGVDRLESELQSAHKECELLRQKIRYLENDLEDYRKKNNNLTTELTEKSVNLTNYETETNAKIAELSDVIKNLETKIESLKVELETLKQEKANLEEQRTVLLAERDVEKKKVEEILEQATAQKEEIEKKWKLDFEKLRTINIMKEQQLLDDFEWKLREIQQTCKKRLDDKDRTIEERLQEAYKEAEKKMKEAEKMMEQVEAIKSYEIEIEKLRGLTVDQENAIKEMVEQQEQMKQAENNLRTETKRLRNLIEMEKENLQHMQMKHHQEILDKERTLQQTLHQKRTEIAMYWEERLLRECGRLKTELEQIHNEEKHYAMETVRRDKDEEFHKAQAEWDRKMKECLKEITNLKRALIQKDEYYREEMVRSQTNTDREILELRRLMDKIDMCHHNRFEKVVQEHEAELERISEETEKKIKEIEVNWQNQVTSLSNTLEFVKEQMEKESQQKIESLIEQHRSELDSQWENLISQKSEAVNLVEEEYITKYQTLEEQFLTQQKSHQAREIDLLKVIDSLKNELGSKDSALDDLQSNVDTLEGGIQVLNEEIAQQNDQLTKNKKESEHKIRGLQETIIKLHEQQEKEREAFRLKLMGVQKQSQETINHLQRKCQCLTKLFEEVRLRYERRESRQEDLNIISDLRQVIAEQEKDLACLNEEKRYFQMRLISLEKRLEGIESGDEEAFEDAEQPNTPKSELPEPPSYPPNGVPPPSYPNFPAPHTFSIPPTIPECDE